MPDADNIEAVAPEGMDLDDSHAERMAEREKGLRGLRAMVEWLEANPSAALPDNISAIEYCTNAEAIAQRARELGGTWQKAESDGYFELHRHSGPARYELFVGRDAVCEAVIVGKETVRIEEPDPDAPKIVRTVTRDVIEWRCPELLRPAAPDDQ